MYMTAFGQDSRRNRYSSLSWRTEIMSSIQLIKWKFTRNSSIELLL